MFASVLVITTLLNQDMYILSNKTNSIAFFVHEKDQKTSIMCEHKTEKVFLSVTP